MTSAPPVLAWTAGSVGLIYENALMGLADVLGEAGDGHWQRWIEEDLRIWRTDGDTTHHQQAYAGMGSLNDIAAWDRPWLGSALVQLRALAFSAAQTAADDPSRFVQYPGVGPLYISFLRCRGCKSHFVSADEINWAAASGWASYVVPRLVSAGHGAGVLPSVKGETTPDDRPIYRGYVESRLSDLGLQPHEVAGHWVEAVPPATGFWDSPPCPNCGELERYMGSLPIF